MKTMTDVARSLRIALRNLAHRPGYAAAVILTLALGIGANVLVFSVASAVLIRPLPYADPGSLYAISTDHVGPDGETGQYGLGDIEFLRWRSHTTTLQQLEALLSQNAALTGAGDPETVTSGQTSAGLFAMVGARPEHGRLFTAVEDIPRSGVTIVSHEFWVSHLGSRDVLGTSLMVDGEPRVIVGIMPQGFRPLLQAADLWVPLGITETSQPHGPAGRFLTAVGRVKPGMTRAQLQADLRRMSADLERELPDTRRGWTGGATPLHQSLVDGQGGTVVALVVLVGFLLLLACVNVANLTLARIASRRTESAVRLALGGGTWDMLQGPFVETLLLAVMGAILGVGAAAGAVNPLAAFEAHQIPLLYTMSIDIRVLAFAAGLTLFTAAICIAIPSAHTMAQGTPSLLSTGRRSAGGAGDRRTRRTLMTVQIAFTLVLLAGAASMIRVLVSLGRVTLGYAPDGVEVAELSLPTSRYGDSTSRAQFAERLLRSTRAIPGVASASIVTNRFQFQQSRQTILTIEGRPTATGDGITAHFRRIGTDYFATMRIPIVRGRAIADIDRADGLPTVVVSSSFVHQYWPTEDPIGKRIKRSTPGAPWATVVGVASDVRDAGPSDPLGPMIYVPYVQASIASLTLVARTAGAPSQIARGLRNAVRTVDPLQAIDHLAPLREYLADSLATQRFRALLLTLFAVLGLALASVGIYSVTAYVLTERTREIAIRLALGSHRANVLRFLSFESAQWVAAGVGAGVVAAVALAAIARSRVSDIVQVDLAATGGVAILLMAVAMMATLIPALRIVRLSLASALRGDQ